VKEKFEDIEEIKENKNKLEIVTNKDIRRKLLVYLNEKYDILEFYSKKIDLSDVFFKTIK